MSDDKEEIHTAIATWSGYVYQGKVAIYHVVKLILDDKDKCQSYSLQLDSIEDFAILDKTGDGINVMSMHQVKALKIKSYNGYKVAIQRLQDKTINYNGHKINFNDNQRFFHVAQELDTKGCDIKKDFIHVSLYKYENDKEYCGVDEIDKNIENILEKIWKDNDLKKNPNHLIVARQYLDDTITKKISEIHKLVHDDIQKVTDAAFKHTIAFSEIINILDDKNDLFEKWKQEDAYYFYLLKRDIQKYHQDFCIEKEGNLSEEQQKKLSLYLQEIISLEKEDMISFIRNIAPHKHVKINTIQDYKDNTICKDEFKYGFLEILSQLSKTEIHEKKYLHWCKNRKNFIPTAINAGQSQATRICKDIYQNAQETHLDILYESFSLINQDINISSIVDACQSILRYDEDKQNEDRISQLGKTSLISLDKTEKEIND